MKKRKELQQLKEVFLPTKEELGGPFSILDRYCVHPYDFLRPSHTDLDVLLARAKLKKELRERFETGDREAIFDLIAVLGEEAFLIEWVQEQIRRWRAVCCLPDALDTLDTVTINGKKIRVNEDFKAYQRTHASRMLRRIGDALARVGGGRAEELTQAHREQNRRTSNRVSQHEKRVRQRIQVFIGRFRDAEERLAAKGRTDLETLQEVAKRLIAEERTKRGKIQKQACDKFGGWVKDYLKSRSGKLSD